MRITERNGILVECTDPQFVTGVHRAWITDKRPMSPDCGLIVGYGIGDNPGAAIEAATAAWAQRVGERQHAAYAALSIADRKRLFTPSFPQRLDEEPAGCCSDADCGL